MLGKIMKTKMQYSVKSLSKLCYQIITPTLTNLVLVRIGASRSMLVFSRGMYSSLSQSFCWPEVAQWMYMLGSESNDHMNLFYLDR